MRLIDADEAKKQINQMQTLKAKERNLLRLSLDRTPTYEPPNDPLTLDELREMDGEPVWIFTRYDANKSFWAIINTADEDVESYARVELFEDYGEDWLAYCRKPSSFR